MIPSRNNPPTQAETKQQFQTATPIEINIKIFDPLISQQNAIPIFPKKLIDQCYVIITCYRLISYFIFILLCDIVKVISCSDKVFWNLIFFDQLLCLIQYNWFAKSKPVIHLTPWPWDLNLSGSPLINKCRVNWHSCFAKRTPSSSFGGDTNNTRGKIRRNKCLIHAGNGGWLLAIDFQLPVPYVWGSVWVNKGLIVHLYRVV